MATILEVHRLEKASVGRKKIPEKFPEAREARHATLVCPPPPERRPPIVPWLLQSPLFKNRSSLAVNQSLLDVDSPACLTLLVYLKEIAWPWLPIFATKTSRDRPVSMLYGYVHVWCSPETYTVSYPHKVGDRVFSQ